MSAESTPAAAPAAALATLEARVAGLERELTVVQGVLDALPYGLFWKDTALVYRGCNKLGLAASGLDEPAKLIGHTDSELPWNREQAEAFVADDREVMVRRVG